jgi:stage III sporulation protein AD
MGGVLLKLCGIALLSVFLILIVKKSGADIAVLIKIAAAVLLGGASILAISPIIEYMYELSGEIDLIVPISVVGVLVKVLCVAFICQICASICRDCGEGNIAYYVELGGKVEILLLSLDLIGNLVDTTREILEFV